MADFEIAYAKTNGHEGGYANNPTDRGGETYMGISRNNFPNAEIWKYIDNYKAVIRKMGSAVNAANLDPQLKADPSAQSSVKAFYKKNFWDSSNLSSFTNQDIANEVYDSSVNCGIETAAKWLQRSINAANRNQAIYSNILVDGNIGAKTIAALSKVNAGVILKMVNCLQGAYYIAICERNEPQEVFINSWFSRVAI